MIIIGFICAYLMGAIPFAYIFTKLTKHVDIRTQGSGNVGATNVMRVAGGKMALLVLILDILKGILAASFLAFIFAPYTQMTLTNVMLLFAAGAVIGHIWTIFLKFKGGKGVATSLGACIGLSFYLADFRFLILIALVSWILFFILTKYVSVGSIVAALSLPVTAVLKSLNLNIVLFCVFIGTLIILKHHENINRIFTKKETKIYLFKKSR
ncbi:MAG: glycerol-3-phosphate 1-O-acyltransferase PlsY [Candidatus Omnitrophota bacterium]